MMSGKPRAARPMPRLAGLLISRNDLKRSLDRVEAAVVAMLLAVFVAVVALACVLGVHAYQSQRAAAARLRPVVAVLSQNGPADSLAGYGQAQARWRAPDGRQRSGPLTTDTAPGIWNAVAGSRVRVWVTGAGDPAARPSQPAMILTALLFPFWGSAGAGIVLVICYWAGRRVIDRRRLAAWESEWARIGPRWTTRR
jgi:hypothetical protein